MTQALALFGWLVWLGLSLYITWGGWGAFRAHPLLGTGPVGIVALVIGLLLFALAMRFAPFSVEMRS